MLKKGQKIPNFDCLTKDGIFNIKEIIKNKKTILIFLRFYGCRITQYELKDFSDYYESLKLKNYNLIIILQSSIETIENAYKTKKYPFLLISDLNEEIYKMFDIKPALNREVLSSDKDKLKVKKADEFGLKKGLIEGNILQLPAEFLINENLEIEYSYYGKTSGDILNPIELIEVINSIEN